MARVPWRGLLLPLVGALLVFIGHDLWYRAFPQVQDFPPDQAAYLIGGRSILEAVPAIATFRFHDPSVEAARRWFDFFGVALLYGSIDAIRPNDLSFFRHVLALLNAVAAIGVFRLARQIGGTTPATFALLFFIASPAFPSGAGRLYPDAATSGLIVWSLSLFVEARDRKTSLLAGLLLGAALLIRIQLVPWIPALLVLLFAATFPWWRTSTDSKRAARWAGLGFLLVGGLFTLISMAALENEDPRSPKHNLPKYQKYAAGVWRFLDSDGWDGPYRQNQEPFYDALVAASANQPALLTSRARQYVFAAGYLWDRRAESAPLVLDNMFRTFGVPQNPEHRSFIGDEASLVFLHRLALLAAVVGGLVACSRGGFTFSCPQFPCSSRSFMHSLFPGRGMRCRCFPS